MNRLVAALALVAMPLLATDPKTAVIGSQHDLTPAGSGPVKSAALNACVFCHAPHNIAPNIPPLWDHTLSTQAYTPYTSSTYGAGAETPGAGSSTIAATAARRHGAQPDSATGT